VPVVGAVTNAAGGVEDAVARVVGGSACVEAEGTAGRCQGASAGIHAARVQIRCCSNLLHPWFSMVRGNPPNAGHRMTARTHANVTAAAAPD
jgi:hypothetical protein